MSAPDGEEVLVLRQLAALREAGWSLGAALGLVLEALRDSALKARLADALASLQAGHPPRAGDDALVATLTRGDANSAKGLERLAEARELDTEATQARRRLQALVAFFVSLGLGEVTLFAWKLPEVTNPLFSSLGTALPTGTELTLELALGLRLIAPVLLASCLAVVARARFRSWSGERELRGAAALLQFTSALEAGLSESGALALIDPKASTLLTSAVLGFDRLERRFLDFSSACDGAAAGASALASELLARGRQLATRSGWLLGLAGAVLTLSFASGVLVSMYLPIFSIAGAIK